jgi:hypothetical protein
MKHRILLIISLLSFFGVFGLAGGKNTTPPPTVTVNCTDCSATQSLIITGSGYKGRSRVQLDIDGPVSYTIVTTADSNGNIYVDFGTTLCYNPGGYVVYASVVSGNGATLVAVSQPFIVE